MCRVLQAGPGLPFDLDKALLGGLDEVYKYGVQRSVKAAARACLAHFRPSDVIQSMHV